jgi:hypothetical protein
MICALHGLYIVSCVVACVRRLIHWAQTSRFTEMDTESSLRKAVCTK